MFNFLGAGWEAVAPAVPKNDGEPTSGPAKRRTVVPIKSSTTEDESDDEIAKEMLVQFPVYGTRSQAQASNLNPTADWLLGGTANIPSQQQLLMKQQQEQMQQEEENAQHDEKEPKTVTLKEPIFSIKDWDSNEQSLWNKSTVSTQKEKNVNLNNALAKEEEKKVTTSTTPQFEDPAKDWMYAYYYHTGVTPNIEFSRPHPLFDRGPTSGLRKSLPRSAFSGFDSIKVLNDTVPGLVQDDLDWYEEYDGSIPTRSQPSNSRAVAKSLEDRQHWMPDRLCKHCYACDTPFTVFRRRHHCRICGQVFCNNCSGFFVPSEPTEPNQNPTTKTILRACKMCYDQVSERRQIEEEEDVRKRRKNLEATPGQISTPVQGQPGVKSPSLQQSLNQEDSVLTSLSKKQEGSLAQTALQSQEEALERDEQEQAAMMLHSKKAEQEREEIHQVTRGVGSPDRAFHKRLVHVDSNGSLGEHNRAKLVEEGNRHLGLTAAAHLEELGKALLSSDAPLLYPELCQQTAEPNKAYSMWLEQLMILATRCCATVEPNVKKGDLLDIRPYVKIKVIPGGTIKDCAYVSGIVFRKTVSHKQMARAVNNPSIMLLSGGIEFTRTENRIASLETLLEQESTYIEILVGKILKVKPDILMVGRAVSRRAQELLLEANVTLVQHVKVSLLNRISRQTGATIISSTDHIMNQFGAHVLGRCNRFRIIVARNNEVWVDRENIESDEDDTLSTTRAPAKDLSKLLYDTTLSNAERQSVLAADMLGEDIQDGYEAVKAGLAKRGVTQTYLMLEGCPKERGCTVILRGLSRKSLKQLKVVFRFLVNIAYNLRLESSFLKERCARLHPDYEVKPENVYSSSLCVDYGQPPSNRKIRPWNGGSSNDTQQRSMSGQITAFDHQSILITSVWMTDKSQCCPAEVKGIHYYSQQDVALGQFLRDSCFDLSLKCKGVCRKSVLDHSLSFVHNDGLVNITVDHMDDPLPPAPPTSASYSHTNEEGEVIEDPPIATWTYCKNCSKVVTPLVFLSNNTWKYSFGKFLESFFYNRQLIMNSPQSDCMCSLRDCTLYFGCGRLAARFTYEQVRPFGVFVRKCLPIDLLSHRNAALRELEQISMASSLLFVKFDKHIEKVSRETRSLYNSTAHRLEYVQTVLSELNRISSEVDHAAATMSEKIASVSHTCSKDVGHDVSDALLRFPWFARRYLFMLTSAWNEKLSAAGQAIVAMKKIASSANRNESLAGQNATTVNGDQNEELLEGIRRLRQLHEVYSRYNITDISTVLPIFPGGNETRDVEYDDDFEDPDTAIDFVDSVDADVLASRRRLYQSGPPLPEPTRVPTKSLGTRRNDNESLAVTSKVTPGGAVKSALNRLFNRPGRGDYDPYIVDLGMFSEGRPRLEPGINGIVIPVFDEQLCTVIAYSLSSQEYANQLQEYSEVDVNGAVEGSTESGLDPPGGIPSVEPDSISRAAKDTSSNTRTPSSQGAGSSGHFDKNGIERRMLIRNKSHIKHTFRDFDEKGQNVCKFVCTTYWATQFQAVREAFLSPNGVKGSDLSAASSGEGLDIEQAYVQSLSSAFNWAASGGKSGASFARTSDDRFVIKCISRTELQMFLESAPAYFEYLSKAFFHGLPTVLCKIVGVYQIGYHNRLTGKRSMEQVAVMQNIFYNKKISRTFDLKGSLRGRFAAQIQRAKDENDLDTPSRGTDAYPEGGRERKTSGVHGDDDINTSQHNGDPRISAKNESGTLLDGDFLEFTSGRPMPMSDRAKAVFHMSILNDTLFLSIINVLDYSILVGVDEERQELVVGIIDFMRQYDILKQMERVGKSLPMVVGSEAPTIIQPPLYKARFTNAMERYFMTVPSKWTTI